MLDWMEWIAVYMQYILALYVFQYQSDISARKLINQGHLTWFISDGQIFASFKNVRGTHQYYWFLQIFSDTFCC